MYLHLSHDQPGGLLQQGRPVGDSGDRHRRQSAADAALLHGHAAAQARHARSSSRCCRSRRRARTTWRRGWSRAPTRSDTASSRSSSSRKQKIDLRSAADHRAHQPGPGDLAADHALEPAGLAGHPGHAARHPGRRSAALRAAAVSARVRRQDPGAEPRDRRVSGSDCDGGDARRRARRGSSSGGGGRIIARTTSRRRRPRRAPRPQPPAAPPPVDANVAARARQHYERAMQAQREGNWALYGEEIRLLGETLRGMSR